MEYASRSRAFRESQDSGTATENCQNDWPHLLFSLRRLLEWLRLL